ncbi:hypothetical protein K435DRAFT_870487 [Dendrothele bispora CBS 962.96]|uniref:Uncharacterized protein n=1 Tax=Dendrothele bispora (strain CBS 962.96) TaxID=1314807 RepID=A0A4S8L7S2_DENBC|nr:hypothetical protein K435DRAFT_870487 [Dendrothele bispora CBS 962.96]
MEEKGLIRFVTLSNFSVPSFETEEIRGHFLEPLSTHDEEAEQLKLESESDYLFMQAMEEEMEAQDNDAANTNVIEMMRRMGIDVDSGEDFIDSENLVLPTAAIDNNMDYSPYPNKLQSLQTFAMVIAEKATS